MYHSCFVWALSWSIEGQKGAFALSLSSDWGEKWAAPIPDYGVSTSAIGWESLMGSSSSKVTVARQMILGKVAESLVRGSHCLSTIHPSQRILEKSSSPWGKKPMQFPPRSKSILSNQKGYRLHQATFIPKAAKAQAKWRHVGYILDPYVTILSQ